MATRTYQSVRRAEAAAETRRSILDAAVLLFRDEGYQGATVARIAAQAGVSLNAVYSSVGGKAHLLVTLVDQVADDPTIRTALDALAPDASGHLMLRTLAHGTRAVLEQNAWLLAETFDNAASDDLIRNSIVSAETAYSHRVATVSSRLASQGYLRRDVSQQRAVAILRFHFNFVPWRALLGDGWNWSEAEDWLLSQASHALIAGGDVDRDRRASPSR